MPSSKGPAIVMSLLVAMLGLSAGAIALIIYFNANRPDSAAIAAACKGEVGAAISRESSKVTAACEAAAAKAGPKSVSVADAARRPGFTYPAGWSAFGTISNDAPDSYLTYIDPKFLDFTCFECDGPQVAIVMHTTLKDAATITAEGSLKSYVTKQFIGAPTEPTSITEETINGFPVIVVKGKLNEMVETSWEEKIIFAGTKNIVWINVSDFGPASTESELKKEWPAIKASLNFSKIE